MAAALEHRAIPAHDFSESWWNTEMAFDQEEQIQSCCCWVFLRGGCFFLDGELVTHDPALRMLCYIEHGLIPSTGRYSTWERRMFPKERKEPIMGNVLWWKHGAKGERLRGRTTLQIENKLHACLEKVWFWWGNSITHIHTVLFYRCSISLGVYFFSNSIFSHFEEVMMSPKLIWRSREASVGIVARLANVCWQCSRQAGSALFHNSD